jgi:hypothetical protein
MVTTYARWIHLGAAWLFVAGVVLQAFLAGQAIPQLGGTGNFEGHIGFGYTGMGLLALGVLVAGLIGRVPRRQVGLSIGLVILYIVQTSLPYAKASTPVIAALHPANAMLLLVLGIYVAVRARRLASGEEAARP